MTSLTKRLHPPTPKFFRVQTTRLAESFDWVCSAYWTREIPMQSHLRSSCFFHEPLESTQVVILCQMNQKIGEVNPPSQIFLKFHKQKKMFMLIPKNLILLKLIKVLQSYGPYNMTTSCGQ